MSVNVNPYKTDTMEKSRLSSEDFNSDGGSVGTIYNGVWFILYTNCI